MCAAAILATILATLGSSHAHASLGPLDEFLSSLDGNRGDFSAAAMADARASALSLASIQTDEYLFAVAENVPDGDFSGLSDTREIPAANLAIQSLAVELVLSPVGDGGFLGDLYVTLTHDGGGYAVLLNRVGRQPDRPGGYSDGVPVDIALRDDAPADIHRYRLTLNGDDAVPLPGDLSGPWQPDGREVDPMQVVTADPRTAMLGSFAGVNPGGTWTLFVADVSAGGQYRLDSWMLAITLVPEPGTLALLGLGGLASRFLGERALRRVRGRHRTEPDTWHCR